MRLIKQPFFSIVNNHLIEYPTPINIHYAWNFGFLASICLIIQVLTGIFLSMHYIPHIDLAFSSVEHIMRDVNYGWLLRYAHSNGASMFFIVVYIHMFRGLYYASYVNPRHFTWVIGVIIYLLMMGTAFLGYVLPWGQMSFWGATVITNFVTIIPVVGKYILEWLWGGFSINNATLHRFFCIHYLLPFILIALSLIHLAFLHQKGSGNPLGVNSSLDKVSMYPYFIYKDFLGLSAFILFVSLFLFYAPNLLGHSINYLRANSISTPLHIVPEWYFLPFYAMLRSIPHKTMGVVTMLAAIIILMLLPWIHSTEIRSSRFRPLYRVAFWVFLACCFLLGWIGSQPMRVSYILLGQITSLYYFFHLLIIVPTLGKLERVLLDYKND